MRVPSVWSLDDAGGNSFIQSQSTQLINFGRSAGTTRIRSGATDLIHTKETNDYTIWDASNLSDPVTKSGDNIFTGNNSFTAGQFNVGSFIIGSDNEVAVNLSVTEGGTTTVNGSLVVNAMGSLPVIINNSDSNGTDVIQTFRVQGYNRFLVGWSETSGGPFIQRSSDNSCILIKSDGAYWGSSLGSSSLKKLATQEWVLEQLEALKTS